MKIDHLSNTISTGAGDCRDHQEKWKNGQQKNTSSEGWGPFLALPSDSLYFNTRVFTPWLCCSSKWYFIQLWAFRTTGNLIFERNLTCIWGKKMNLNIQSKQLWWHFLKISENQHSDARNKNQELSSRNPPRSINHSIQTFVEQISFLNTERHEFEYRDKSLVTARFEVADQYNSEARNEINDDFSVEQVTRIRKILIETLVEEKGPVVTEIYDFEYRHQSKLKTLFEILGHSGFWYKRKNNFPIEYSFKSLNYSIEILHEKNHACSFGELWVWPSRWINVNSTSWSFRLIRILMQGEIQRFFGRTLFN